MQIKIVEFNIRDNNDLHVSKGNGLHWTDAPIGSRVYTQFSAWMACHSAYTVWVRVQCIMNVFYF